MRLLTLLNLMIFICGTLTFVSVAAEPALHSKPVVRRPISLITDSSHDAVWIANRETGTLSHVDLQTRKVVAESRVARSLSDAVASEQWCFLLDREQHEILLSSRTKPSSIITRQRVARDPVTVVVAKDGAIISVASQWSRRVTLLNVISSQPPKLQRLITIDLPFAPLEQCLLDDRHLLVADAFAGQLALIDIVARRLVSLQQINGHNIRGLAITPDHRDVMLTQQLLYPSGETKQSNISWGGVITNMLHALPIAELLKSRNLDESRPERIHDRMWPLGEQGRAAGDPGRIAFNSEGDLFVALNGVSEVACKRNGEQQLLRASVGLRPTTLHLDEMHNRLLVVNTNDDSLSVLDARSLNTSATIPLGPTVVKNSQQQGEDLFYDARLSFDGWYSCHSCHSNGHSNGLLNDNLGDDTFGTPKHILTLLGTGLSEPWAWNGTQADLRNQVRKSVELSMAGPGKTAPRFDDEAIESLTTFIALLPPAPGLSVARENINEPAKQRGEQIFDKLGCGKCHQAPSYASPLKFQVGLKDETGYSEFNPPSLRGVSQRSPFFHDNRAKRLRDVFEEHDHAGAARLTEDELNDLIEFLNSL